MNAIGLILLVVLLAVAIWNWVSLRTLKKLAKRDESPTADAKYYELKYNIQFLVGMSTVLIAVVGILGYKTMEDVKKDFSAGAKISVDSIEHRLKSFSEEIKSKENKTRELDGKIVRIEEKAKEADNVINQVKSLESKIKSINEKNILKQNYYIVPSIKYVVSDTAKKIYFKDLFTNKGDRLPEFRVPPLVFATQDLNTSAQIFNITTKSFDLVWAGSYYESSSPYKKDEQAKFSLLIFEK